MSIHLLSFATGDMRGSQRDLVASALANGVDKTLSAGPDWLDTDFIVAQNHILNNFHSRGAGYWLWKPYLILNALAKLPMGDWLLYSDVGVTIIAPVVPLTKLGTSIVLFKVHHQLVRTWTKRDCLAAMTCDMEEYYDQELTNAAFQLYQNTPAAIDLLKQYLFYGCRDICINDERSGRFVELPGFMEHRHDQSILTLLSLRANLPRFRDPSQWGNLFPESKSAYGQIFLHHRNKH